MKPINKHVVNLALSASCAIGTYAVTSKMIIDPRLPGRAAMSGFVFNLTLCTIADRIFKIASKEKV